MKTDNKCPKCGGEMQEGWIPDSSYTQVLQPFWSSGASHGLINKTWDDKHDVMVFRCKSCGYLESYAK